MRSAKIMAIMVILFTVVTVVGFGSVRKAEAHPLQGAIFTTLLDGSVVNGNIYSNKCNVALNGGPQGQHHLPNGKYDVAITNPNGHNLLGLGELAVSIDNGIGTFKRKSLCDLVVPSPYLSTTNNGGEYKVWLCQSEHLYFSTNGELIIQQQGCKTDNFKVRSESTPTPELIPPEIATPTEPTPTYVSGLVPNPTPTPTTEAPPKIGLPDTGQGDTQSAPFPWNQLIVGLVTMGFVLTCSSWIIRRSY